jgi:hypothetical protein
MVPVPWFLCPLSCEDAGVGESTKARKTNKLIPMSLQFLIFLVLSSFLKFQKTIFIIKYVITCILVAVRVLSQLSNNDSRFANLDVIPIIEPFTAEMLHINE